MLVRLPRLSDNLRAGCICEALGSAVLPCKERRLAVVLEGRPVAADSAVVGDNGLENTAVVVGMMPVFGREHDVAGLVADEIFVVGRNQQGLAFSEAGGRPSLFLSLPEPEQSPLSLQSPSRHRIICPLSKAFLNALCDGLQFLTALGVQFLKKRSTFSWL